MLTRPAYRTSRLLAVLLACAMGNLILRWASHLDAFSGYPIRRSLLSYATGVTTDTQALRPPRSSRTRGSSSQISIAYSG